MELLYGGIQVMKLKRRGMLGKPTQMASAASLNYQLPLNLSPPLRHRCGVAFRTSESAFGSRKKARMPMLGAPQICLPMTSPTRSFTFPASSRSVRFQIQTCKPITNR
jgi:hypothetical protein